MRPVVVDSCLRRGNGGSPTAVLLSGEGLPDDELALLPVRLGASHLAVIGEQEDGAVPVRFFTASGPLTNCGHGAVAAVAVLAADRGGVFEGALLISGREVAARAEPCGDVLEAWFDQGSISFRPVSTPEREAFLAAIGLGVENLHPAEELVVASPGRDRLLVPVADRAALAALRPDQALLAEVSFAFGRLGCFAYVPPSGGNPAVARMSAPAIGVAEDVANANSSGCLAAHRLATGRGGELTVEQGDAPGRPSAVFARAVRDGPRIVASVGGAARVRP